MNTTSVICFIVFLLNPLFGCFLFLLTLFNHEKLSIFFISLFAGILAYNLVPYDTMDLASHYMKFSELHNMSVSDIWSDGVNIFLYLCMKCLNAAGINKEWLPFIATFIGYYILLNALRNNIPAYWCRKEKMICFIIWLLSISFLSLSNGIRSGLSSAFFIYAVICQRNYKHLSFIIYSVLACMMHSFAIPMVILLFSMPLILKRKMLSQRFFKIAIIMSVSLSFLVDINSLIVFIFNNLSFLPYIDQIYNIYIIGDRWGGGASFDTNTFIARLITQAPFFYCILVLLISKRKDDFFILGAVLVSVSLFLSQFWVVSERYQYVSVLLVTLHLIFNNEYFLLRRKIIILLYFVIQTAVLIWGLYRFRYMILPSLEFIIYPFLFCFYNTVDMNKLIKV